MSFPEIFFSLTSNEQQVFHLETGSIKQRVLQILGNHYNAKLVAVNEQTDYMNIFGFVGKPEAAKKTRGDQYFFINNRFIKSAYLNHAVNSAFDNMLAKDSFPSYVLFIDLDPSQIDINVHPTKQEIKFEDEKIVYAFVQAAVKHALAQFSIAPSLDFTLNAEIQSLDAVAKPFTTAKKEATTTSPIFKTFTGKHQAHKIEPNEKSELSHWKDFFTKKETTTEQVIEQKTITQDPSLLHSLPKFANTYIQIHNTYIIAANNNGFMLVHQQHAHERVLYEKYTAQSHSKQPATQKSLFPITLSLATADAILLEDLLPEIIAIGYQTILLLYKEYQQILQQEMKNIL